ncbi:helix-turn-helix domain-containing protein [Rahnella sp. PD12R]|uniref:helix-turn-helix domain-containing protein n=1 Tax=Rahnella sp. PD12R TaxID=2855688 RepID=UPI001C45ECC6|nr:helix-turn-helix domain-containing protein [Rahnella sp. PD12R]MBV6817985.1 helix-turn-helix domain-containing protein [Rahnella sp. PD12R]
MYDFSKVIEKASSQFEFGDFFSSLKSLCTVKKGKPGQRFNLEQSDKRLCFVLFTGTGLVKRVSDSLVLSSIHGPCIIGLQDIFHRKSDVQVSSTSEVEYGLVVASELFSWAEENGLWKNLCYMLMLSSTRFSEYQKETVGVSNYELICNLLCSLSTEPFEIRATTTALEYIQTRSMLSRSGIMKTLSSLRIGGYITISKGLLIKINSLPKKF